MERLLNIFQIQNWLWKNLNLVMIDDFLVYNLATRLDKKKVFYFFCSSVFGLYVRDKIRFYNVLKIM
jgi:hypothetical protein